MQERKNNCQQAVELGARLSFPRCGSAGELRQLIARECLRCERCLEHCHFLKRYGMPGDIAEQVVDKPGLLEAAYHCSLCQFCTARCPKDLPMAEMFLCFRYRAFAERRNPAGAHRRLRVFEWLGRSALFSIAQLPPDCETVFFPGCALPGGLPEQTRALIRVLRQRERGLGVVLDCCSKPSHDLGDSRGFIYHFSRLHDKLVRRGVRRVITACPSCLQVFRYYGKGLEVVTIYDYLSQEVIRSCTEGDGLREAGSGVFQGKALTVHDPCTVRFNHQLQQQVRQLLLAQGARLLEMPHHGDETFCCGEGGGACHLPGSPASTWPAMRKVEAVGQTLVTYCDGCRGRLAGPDTVHLLELLFPGVNKPGVWSQLLGPLKSYLNRLELKMLLWLDRV